MNKDIRGYYYPYRGALFDKLYEEYYEKLQKGDHLGTHQKFIIELYRSIYGSKIVGPQIDAILFLFYAISNSCDDLIDNSSIENRKKYVNNVVRVYISFFIFFEKIVCSIDLFDEMKGIFEVMRTELPNLIAAPHNELAPKKDMNNIPATVIEIENNRCLDHQFICKVLNAIVEKNMKFYINIDRDNGKNASIIPDLYKIVVLYKGFEFIIKDLTINELVEDINSYNFNIITYLFSKIGITKQDDFRKVLNETRRLILQRANEINRELELPKNTFKTIQSAFEQLEINFEDKMNEFEKQYQRFSSLMKNV